MINFIKEIFLESYRKHILLLSSSSTFFLMISIIPLLLLSLKTVGLIMGNPQEQAVYILKIIVYFLPDNLQGLANPIKSLVMNSLFASKELTTINITFLIISAFGFINSIWRGLLVISEDNSVFSFYRYIKYVVILLITIVFFILLLLIPFLLKTFEKFLELEIIRSSITFLQLDTLVNIGKDYILTNDYLVWVALIIYMLLFFKIILGDRVRWRVAVIGNSTFFGFLFILRTVFNYYMNIAQKGLVTNYGAYYSFIFIIFWMFAFLTIFYFSVIAMLYYEKKNLPPPLPIL